MSKMIAYCGLNCSQCPAFIATQNDDEELREKTAKKWSEAYKSQITPDMIYCDGCKQDEGYLISHCKVCKIRSCAREKEVETCAFCEDFACEKLQKFLDLVPEAKENLMEQNKNQ